MPAKRKAVEDFQVPTLNLSVSIFSGKLAGTDVEEVFEGILNEITSWMSGQVGRNHYNWAKERVDKIQERHVKEGQTVLTPEELEAIEKERDSLVQACHDFVSRIVEKIQEEKNAIQLNVQAEKVDGEKEKAELLLLGQKDLLVYLLKGRTQGIKTNDLALLCSQKLGIGFAKRFDGKKLNHALNDFPDVFHQTKAGWTLKAGVA